jgi:hypothetical protein
MSDAVNNPKHYTAHPSGIECIELTRRMSFNRGNALKYIWRAGLKDNHAQDIEKAKWYLIDEYKHQLPAVYSVEARENLIGLLQTLALYESHDRIMLINNIIFGEWMTLKGASYLL